MRRSNALLTTLLPFALVLLWGACGGAAQAPHETVAEPEPPPPPPSPFASADWRDVLPAGPLAVVGMRVPAVFESEPMQLMLATDPVAQSTFENVRQAAQACGLAFPADLHTVRAGWYSGADVVALGRGSFDQQTIAACLSDLAASRNATFETTEIAGYWVSAFDDGMGTSGWLSVPVAGTLVLTNTRAALEATLRADAVRMADEDSALTAWLARVPQDKPLWGAGVVVPGAELASVFVSMMGGRVEAPAAAYGFADFESGMEAELHVAMQGEADARALLGRINQQLTFVRAGLALDGSGFLLDRLTLGTEEAIASARVALTVEDLEFIRGRVAPAAAN